MTISAITIDPCDKRFYRVLNDADRAAGFVTGKTTKCDRTSKNRVIYDNWYRFNGSAGVAMPTNCVDTMRCGAKGPGWLYDSHPREVEGVVNRSVCFHLNDKCCYYKTEIQVKNCRSFYVYKFHKPPANYLRYCGNGTSNNTAGEQQ